MGVARILFAVGVFFAAVSLALSPAPWLGFAAIAAGCIWYAYDMVEVTDDEPPSSSPR